MTDPNDRSDPTADQGPAGPSNDGPTGRPGERPVEPPDHASTSGADSDPLGDQDTDATAGMETDAPADTARMRRDVVSTLREARRFVSQTVNIHEDADHKGTIETIRKDMVFRGPVVWVLISSIFIASIGLDTNSAAVVIGAMLISPLMGPILAIGLAVGTYDIKLLRQAMKHFVVMVGVSLLTATVYFLITPLGEAQSELLSRTRPTLLDAMIGAFGGLAGIVAVSRRERGNVIPGVAIATALMPPLCTAGYGLATGNWPFFFGAFYLFMLNSVFIAIATFVIVRYLHFPTAEFIDAARRRQVLRAITAFVLITLAPSAWILYGVVRESLFQRRARDFLAENLSIPGVQIVNQTIRYSADSTSVIEVFLVGDSVPSRLEQTLASRMAASGLSNTALQIHQPQDVARELGRISSEVRVGIIEDLYERNALTLAERDEEILALRQRIEDLTQVPLQQLSQEIQIQYPAVEEVSYGEVARVSGTGLDTVPTFMVRWRDGSDGVRATQEAQLSDWLRVRLGLENLRLLEGPPAEPEAPEAAAPTPGPAEVPNQDAGPG